MKKLKIGVIGTGDIGKFHINTIIEENLSAEIVAVTSRRRENAEKTVNEFSLNAKVYDDDEGVINDKNVDAVIITTPTPHHKKSILKAIKEEKFVFVEKPLAATAEEGLEIVEAEKAKGKKLVNVGFMRRYDKGYRNLKKELEKGSIGEPLIVYNKHRDPSEGASYKTEMAITESLIHEIDTIRWLLGENFNTAKVIFPKKSQKAFDHVQDPQMIKLITESGVVVVVEIFANAQYGYDIQCEVVGEEGVLNLTEEPTLTKYHNNIRSKQIPVDYKDRFADAFTNELRSFIDTILMGEELKGPNTWDGYVASLTADACLRSQRTMKEVTIKIPSNNNK